jgi:hypothetical protein
LMPNCAFGLSAHSKANTQTRNNRCYGNQGMAHSSTPSEKSNILGRYSWIIIWCNMFV